MSEYQFASAKASFSADAWHSETSPSVSAHESWSHPHEEKSMLSWASMSTTIEWSASERPWRETAEYTKK